MALGIFMSGTFFPILVIYPGFFTARSNPLIITFTSSLRDAVAGAETMAIEARTIGELFRKLVERYPRMQEHLDVGVAVSIDGQIYRDDWSTKIPEDATEVFLIPRIQGG
jgi:molybdopterin synthase sulfur carrier subunit